MADDTDRRRLALGDRFRSIRIESGLTAREMSKRTGWVPSRISKIENGVQLPRATDVEVWCESAGASKSILDDVVEELSQVRLGVARDRELQRKDEHAAFTSMLRGAHTLQLVSCGEVPRFLLPDSFGDCGGHELGGKEIDERITDLGEAATVLLGESGIADFLDRSGKAGAFDELARVIESSEIVGILPLDQPLAFRPKAPYWIVDDEVFVDYPDEIVHLSDRASVDIYRSVTDQLWAHAHSPDRVGSFLDELRTRIG